VEGADVNPGLARGSIKTNVQKRTIAIASLFLLLGAISGCARVQTSSFEWRSTLKECRTAEAVQIQFREGLVGHDAEQAAIQQLAKELPIPVISGADSMGEKKTLKIFIDGAEINFYDANSFPKALITTAGKHAVYLVLYTLPIPVSGLLSAPVAVLLSNVFSISSDWALQLIFVGLAAVNIGAEYGFMEGAAVATSGYFSHKSFRKKHGYLPYHFKAFSTFSDYALSLDGVQKKDRTAIPKYRYKLIEFPGAMRQIDQKDNKGEIAAASLEAWVQALAADLNKHKIGSKAKQK
jgi:hypothetical protein